MRFFGRPSRHRRRTSVISTIVTSRYIQGLLRRAEARAGDVYRAVRRRGKGFEKLSAQRGKGFEKVLTEGSIGFENRQWSRCRPSHRGSEGCRHSTPTTIPSSTG